MPLYEYVCEADGSVLELIRPMSEADKPVPDPEGKGRCFVRKQISHLCRQGEGGSVPLGIRSGGGGCAWQAPRRLWQPLTSPDGFHGNVAQEFPCVCTFAHL